MDNVTREEFLSLIKNTSSYKEILISLSLKPYSANYRKLKGRLLELDINPKDIKFGKKRPDIQERQISQIHQYLSNKSKIGSNALKRKLLSHNYFESKCYKCGITTWLNEPAPLELHHINHNPVDNTLSNLIILCANCHSLEHRNLNTQKEKKVIKRKCNDCDKLCSITASRCRSCATKLNHAKKLRRPNKEQLVEDFKNLKSFVQVGKKYGVSDNAVRKWCVTYNLLFSLTN